MKIVGSFGPELEASAPPRRKRGLFARAFAYLLRPAILIVLDERRCDAAAFWRRPIPEGWGASR